MGIKNVSAELKKVRTSISIHTSAQIGNSVKALYEDMVLATPIDTGRAREGWEISEVKKDKDRVYITLSNDVPYIQALNQGHSQQAPARFIEKPSRTLS